MDHNLFMMCKSPNLAAFRDAPEGYHFRLCRPDELEVWKRLSVGDPEYIHVVTEYFEKVYAPYGDEFFKRCTFACDESDTPVGTCFLWPAYKGRITTFHWYRVLPRLEGKGIGRALMSHVLKGAEPGEYPIYIHTHPTSNRAIHLYSEFGFDLLTDERIGHRDNHLKEGLELLKETMPEALYSRLKTARATEELLSAALTTEYGQF